jgi:hypothetical protein
MGQHSVVPNQPATQGRSVRVPDDLWEWVQGFAADEGVTATEIVLRALRAYRSAHDY